MNNGVNAQNHQSRHVLLHREPASQRKYFNQKHITILQEEIKAIFKMLTVVSITVIWEITYILLTLPYRTQE